MVPSFKPLTLTALTLQVVPVTVALTAVVEWPPPSLITTLTVAPASTVPDADVLVWFALLTGLVTVVSLSAGAVASLLVVLELVAVFAGASVGVAVSEVV